MHLGDRAIAWLRTPIATLIVLVAALLAQLPHAADVFRLVVQGDGIWQILHSYSYAVALELAVLLFVVQRRNVESYVFAVVSVCVNLAYYALHGVNLFTIAALPAWLISIALPAAIARYSHLIVDAAQQSDAAPAQSVQADADEAQQSDAAPQNPAQTSATSAQPDAGAAQRRRKTDAELRRAQIAQLRIDSAAEIAHRFGVSLRTAQADLAAVRNATTQRNGAVH